MKKRTRDPEDLITFKKVGGGSLRMQGQIIKPGQTFKAHPDDIPESFRDVIVPLESIKKDDEEEDQYEVAEEEYTMKARPYGGYYDVFDSQGKMINPKGLRRQAALNLIAEIKGKKE